MGAIQTKTLIRNDLSEKMAEKGLTGDLYASKLDEYMELYEHDRELQKVARRYADDPGRVKVFIECTKEMRQIRKSMQETLRWLGISPADESATSEPDDYDL